MDPIRVIIGDVITDQTAQMNLVKDDDMIEKLISTAFDPAFRNSVLPRTREACACGLHSAGCEEIGYLLAKLGITIQNHVAAWTRSAKSLPQLLHNPMSCRMFCHIEMEDLASAVIDDEKTV